MTGSDNVLRRQERSYGRKISGCGVFDRKNTSPTTLLVRFFALRACFLSCLHCLHTFARRMRGVCRAQQTNFTRSTRVAMDFAPLEGVQAGNFYVRGVMQA